jgi:hypothetical protein
MPTHLLFLIFNSPNTTKHVFQKIREARPPRLYVAADGPHEDRIEDPKKCEEVREIVASVDWYCEVKTLLMDKNLGCKHAVIGLLMRIINFMG